MLNTSFVLHNFPVFLIASSATQWCGRASPGQGVAEPVGEAQPKAGGVGFTSGPPCGYCVMTSLSLPVPDPLRSLTPLTWCLIFFFFFLVQLLKESCFQQLGQWLLLERGERGWRGTWWGICSTWLIPVLNLGAELLSWLVHFSVSCYTSIKVIRNRIISSKSHVPMITNSQLIRNY